MSQISLFLAVIAFGIFISPYFSKISKIPIAPVEIILGIIFASFGFLPQSEFFDVVSEIGFLYLMFLAGLEIDIKNFSNFDKKLITPAILFLLFLYLVSIISASFFKSSMLVFVVISLTSVGMLGSLFKEYGKDEHWLNTALIIGSVGEIISIFFLSVMSSFIEYGNSLELYLQLNYLLLFIALAILGFKAIEVLFWWFPGLKILLMPHFDKDEKAIRLSMALFFAVVAVTIWLKIELAFGAFIAGIFIATFFNHNADLPHKLSSFGFGFLVPIFFIHVGSSLGNELDIMNFEILKISMIILLFILGVRIVGSLVFIKNFGFLGSMKFALSLSMPLTLLIATATIAKEASIIQKDLYFSLVLTSLFEVILDMILIKFINYLENKRKSISKFS